MCKLCSAKLSKNNTKIITVNLLYVYSESDVDVTGVTEVNVNDSCYLLANDSVILKGDMRNMIWIQMTPLLMIPIHPLMHQKLCVPSGTKWIC